MIKEFVDIFIQNKEKLKEEFSKKHPESYKDIVYEVVKLINPDQDYNLPDFQKIYEIDDGDYQGTLLYVIAAGGYQPSEYWFVKVDYGSCGGCDTLQGIRDSGSWDEVPNKSQVEDYLILALHIIQNLKPMQ